MSESEIEDFANFLQETSHLDQNLKSQDPEEYDEDEPASDNAWEESGKFEGDLILNDRQRRMIVTNVVEGLARNGLTDSTKRWPNNEVIYFIQREHFNLDQVQAIQEGIDDLARASCIKFTPYKKGDRDAVVIQGSRRGCFSQVGYQGGYQVLNLSGRHPVGRGCFRHGTVVHELLHTLGFYHMQSSPDRDDYINVMWENIIEAARHNFRKYNSFAVSDFGVGYDYESVLHYSRKAFSVNGQDTLVPKQSGAGIGQRVGLSQKDTQKLNKMYCDADSDVFLDSDSSKPPTVKKKTGKNKPFQGHGIGYHQGKAVAIQLPDAQTFNLHDISTIDKLNDFSGTEETSVSQLPFQGFGVAKKINDVNQNEDLQGLLHRFSDVIKNDMKPTDARKFDYDQNNHMQVKPALVLQPHIGHEANPDYIDMTKAVPQFSDSERERKHKENMYNEKTSAHFDFPRDKEQRHSEIPKLLSVPHFSDSDYREKHKENGYNKERTIGHYESPRDIEQTHRYNIEKVQNPYNKDALTQKGPSLYSSDTFTGRDSNDTPYKESTLYDDIPNSYRGNINYPRKQLTSLRFISPYKSQNQPYNYKQPVYLDNR
ncbi:unnamed protein product [Leptosia nina]|uniref:Metalloendopeptidase n=1 Tax=Leptosia nina TaxID=320188 RepID=A0AAV1JGM4_9NEOP